MRLTGTPWPKLERREWLILLLQAGAGSVGYTTLLIAGLRYSSATDAGVVIGTLPVVSAGIAILLLGERPSRSTLARDRAGGSGRSDHRASARRWYTPFAARHRARLRRGDLRRAVHPDQQAHPHADRASRPCPRIMAGMGVAVAFVPALFEASVAARVSRCSRWRPCSITPWSRRLPASSSGTQDPPG